MNLTFNVKRHVISTILHVNETAPYIVGLSHSVDTNIHLIACWQCLLLKTVSASLVLSRIHLFCWQWFEADLKTFALCMAASSKRWTLWETIHDDVTYCQSAYNVPEPLIIMARIKCNCTIHLLTSLGYALVLSFAIITCTYVTISVQPWLSSTTLLCVHLTVNVGQIIKLSFPIFVFCKSIVAH